MKKIKKYEAAIRTLKEQRNGLAPIFRLPPELLTQIFLHARDTSDGTAKYLPATSHVCRVWRATALGCALLWTIIDCVRVRWAKEMLARSAGAPLTVLVLDNARGIPTTRMRDAICLAFDATPHATSLTLTGCALPGFYGHRNLEWPFSAPLLESLEIAVPAGAREAYDLPDTLVSGSFPQLTRVSLRHCSFAWNAAGFLRQLTDLRVTQRLNSQLLVPDVSKVLHALQDMRLIESLEISLESLGLAQLELEDAPAGIPSNLVNVNLPRLASLELGMHASLLVPLLSHISHPQEQLKVTCALPTVECASAVARCLKQFRLFKMQNGYSMDALLVDGLCRWDLDVCDLSQKEECCPLRVSLWIPYTVRKDIVHVIGMELPFSDMKTVMVTPLFGFNSIHAYLDQCTLICAEYWSVSSHNDFLSRDSFIREDGNRWLPELDTLIFHELDLSSLPKTSKKPDRLTIPGFLRNLGDLCQFVTQLKFFDCRICAQEKLDVLRGKFAHFERHCSPSSQGYRGQNYASTMQKLLGDGRS